MTFEQEGRQKIKRSGKGSTVSHLTVINHNNLRTNFYNNFIGLVFMKLKTLFIQLKIETKDTWGTEYGSMFIGYSFPRKKWSCSR